LAKSFIFFKCSWSQCLWFICACYSEKNHKCHAAK